MSKARFCMSGLKKGYLKGKRAEEEKCRKWKLGLKKLDSLSIT